MNINTIEHWNNRFSSGEWSRIGGNSQTSQFARAQVKRLRLSKKFSGTFVDFGCGEGDAIPIFRKAWPHAKFTGVDFSNAAVERARARYGNIATFVTGSHEACPDAKVIVASNIMEHLDDDIAAATCLAQKCADLFIIVPFEEQYLIDEHVRSYDRMSFSDLNVVRITVFACRGWSHYGFLHRCWHVHTKNLLRPLFGRTKLKPRLQAMYHIRGIRRHG